MDPTRGSTMRARQAAPADVIDTHVESTADLSGAEREKLLQHPTSTPVRAADPAWAPRAGPLLARAELVVLGIVTLLAALVRFYHIERPSSVVYVNGADAVLTRCTLVALRPSTCGASSSWMCIHRWRSS